MLILLLVFSSNCIQVVYVGVFLSNHLFASCNGKNPRTEYINNG